MRTRSFVLLGALLAMTGCQDEPTTPSGPLPARAPDMVVTTAATDSVILMVAGDMHSDCVNPSNRAKATAAIVARYPQALVIPLGDNAGQSGTLGEYACYEQSWGQFKSRTYPTIGNHELNLDPAATAYYDYFNGAGVDSGRAGRRGRAYYTLTYGGWRIFVANTNQNVWEQRGWLIRELAAGPTRCTMAIWHFPFFTSSAKPSRVQNSGWLRPWWEALYKGGADLVVSGHVHNYERFAEMRPDGVVDTARGIREIVAGTGGSGLFDFNPVPRVGSQKRIKTYGVVKLTLWPTRYKWEFIDVTGVVRDKGQDKCH